MSRHLLAALVAPAILLSAQAGAADLPRRTAPAETYYAPPAAYNWQGFYLGINAGYGFSSFEGGHGDILGNPNGGLVGVTAGYNYAFAPSFLVGLEADFDFTGLKASHSPWFGIGGRSAVENILTVRARAGVTFDRALLFVTGGFAGATNSTAIGNAFAGYFGERSKFDPGWAVGGGLEFGVTEHISAKAEYIFTSTGGDHYFDFSPNVLATSVNTSTVKGGVNYRF